MILCKSGILPATQTGSIFVNLGKVPRLWSLNYLEVMIHDVLPTDFTVGISDMEITTDDEFTSIEKVSAQIELSGNVQNEEQTVLRIPIHKRINSSKWVCLRARRTVGAASNMLITCSLFLFPRFSEVTNA